jgi:hypothetical protein
MRSPDERNEKKRKIKIGWNQRKRINYKRGILISFSDL